MPRQHLQRGAIALIALLAAGDGVAAAQVETRSDRPRLRAQRLAEAPMIDGDVLGEELWLDVDYGTGFQQVEPFEGQPASERTEVRVAFDSANLYIAVICFDRDASSLAISDSRRDAMLQNEDSFRVVLDTYGDRQNGFVFGTNIAGIQYDGQFTNQGRGGGSSRSGSSGGANLDWDTSWTVRTSSGDFGWSAEMAIPFRSLRYGSDRAVWGLNFERNIRRKNETAFWAHLGRQHDVFRVSEAGHLVGVEPPRQRNLQLTPYVLSTGRENVDGSVDDSEVGMDLKYSVTPSLTLDVTVNTDFAQVEADDQQINLDRFSLFFPEKRPFFLENSGLFRVGSRSSFRGGTELFFSRRIGLSGGMPVPILGGARLSGRAGGFNVGFLNMQTDGIGDLHGNNFTVARLGREYRNRSRAGVLVVNREGTGSLAPDDDYNRTFAVDGQVGIGQFTDVSGWAARTETPGLTGRDHGFGLDGGYSSPFWRWRLGYAEIGEDFNPEVGFLSRSGYRQFNGYIRRRFRPAGEGRVKEFGPRAFYDGFWNFDGYKETQRYSVGGEVEFRNGAQISLSAGGRYEGLLDPFTLAGIVHVPAGEYDDHGFFLFGNTNRGRAVSLFVRVQGGGFFGGDQLVLDPWLSIRLGDYLTSELSWSYNDIDLPMGAFKTHLGSLRVTYAFSTSLLLQALIQYNDLTHSVNTNVRFSWLNEANRGLFVVYNEISEFGVLGLDTPDRSLAVKFNRTFDVFR
ncbi:MAG: DUF5916 domain-containing protein [Acidobacteriota bacterium]|nr:DUF5916 domain-containing protein [Acidobacteriota bacterium]